MKQHIIATILLLAVFTCTAGAADHDVYDGDSIQTAINSATTGDTIYVHAGTYTENVDVNKRLTLQGDGAGVVTVEAASAAEHVFNLTADYVTITGFRVTGATDFQTAGIYLNGLDNSTIANNVVLGNYINIFIVHSSYNTLKDNIVSEGIYTGISMCDSNCYNTLINNTVNSNAVNGISMRYSNCYNTLINNTVNSNGGNGIYLYNECNYTNIINNTANSNGGNGIYLYVSCNYANIINNTVNLNDGRGGINIYNSCNYSNIINNTVNSNTCGLGGIFVCMSDYNDISDNTVNSNTCKYAGITIYSSSNNIIIGNTAINNTNHSIRMQYGVANLIYNNYFTDGADAFKGSNIWNTTPTTGPNIAGGPEIGGNYWGDYTGTDDDGDGFGDEPYSILDRFTGYSDHDHLPLVNSMPMCGDITGDGNIDTFDLLLLLEYVVTGTPVDACIADIDGNGHINVLDARLLMGYINNPTGYSLHCGC
jgi:parallel beta-helix repeat protein